jgi:hypothetical protein
VIRASTAASAARAGRREPSRSAVTRCALAGYAGGAPAVTSSPADPARQRRTIEARGRIAGREGREVLYDPYYELQNTA